MTTKKTKKKDIREIDIGGYAGTPLLGPTSIFSLPMIKIFSSLDRQDVKRATKKDYGKLFVTKKGYEPSKSDLKKEIGITVLREIPVRMLLNEDGLTQQIDSISTAEIYTPNSNKDVWPANSVRGIIWFAALDEPVDLGGEIIENVVMILTKSQYSEFVNLQKKRKEVAAAEGFPLESFSTIYQHITLSSEYLEDAKFPYYQLRMDLELNDYERVEKFSKTFKALNELDKREMLMLSQPADTAEIVDPNEEESISLNDLPF